MILSDNIRHPKGIYRWNPFLKRAEFWDSGMWIASMFREDLEGVDKKFIVSYRKTWCEPTWEALQDETQS